MGNLEFRSKISWSSLTVTENMQGYEIELWTLKLPNDSA